MQRDAVIEGKAPANSIEEVSEPTKVSFFTNLDKLKGTFFERLPPEILIVINNYTSLDPYIKKVKQSLSREMQQHPCLPVLLYLKIAFIEKNSVIKRAALKKLAGNPEFEKLSRQYIKKDSLSEELQEDEKHKSVILEQSDSEMETSVDSQEYGKTLIVPGHEILHRILIEKEIPAVESLVELIKFNKADIFRIDWKMYLINIEIVMDIFSLIAPEKLKKMWDDKSSDLRHCRNYFYGQWVESDSCDDPTIKSIKNIIKLLVARDILFMDAEVSENHSGFKFLNEAIEKSDFNLFDWLVKQFKKKYADDIPRVIRHLETIKHKQKQVFNPDFHHVWSAKFRKLDEAIQGCKEQLEICHKPRR